MIIMGNDFEGWGKMNSFVKIFQRALKEGKIISVYDEITSLNHFSAGFVKKVTENEVILKKVNKEGKIDGTAVVKIENIVKIQYDGIYERKLEILNNLKDEEEQTEADFDDSENSIAEMLKFAQKFDKIVNISIDEDSNEIIGYVNSIEDDFLEIKTITSESFSDGITILKISDIERVDVDTKYDRHLGIINKMSEKNA